MQNGSRNGSKKNGLSAKKANGTGKSEGSQGKKDEETPEGESHSESIPPPSQSQSSEGQESKRVLAKRDKKLQTIELGMYAFL